MIVKPEKTSNLNRLLKNLSPETSGLLVPYIERYLHEVPHTGVYEVHDTYKEPDDFFHPSGDCMKCKRLLFFEKSPRFEAEWQPSVELRRTFKVGHAVHSMIQAWVADMGTRPGYPKSKYGAEVKAEDESLGIRGSVDDILEFPDGDEVLVEYKTMNGQQFDTLKSPKAEHKLQVQVYLHCRDLPKGIVVYISKSHPHAMKEFVVERGDISHVLERWRRVRECLLADDISPLEFECSVGSKQEKFCPACLYCRNVKR
jgi:hypothetical protein